MRKVLFIALSVLLVIFVTSCALFEKPPLLKTITVDGDLSDWGDYIYTDPSDDSKPSGNEIYKAGIIFDEKNLYIAGEIKTEVEDTVLGPIPKFLPTILVDLSGTNGASALKDENGKETLKIENGNIDLVFLFGFLSVYKEGEFVLLTDNGQIDGKPLYKIESKTTDDGKTRFEISVPLDKIGVTDPNTLKARAVVILVGGEQEPIIPDYAPNQGFEKADGKYTLPITIKKMIENPKK
ncbi:hypothetical protein [Fervidobacterium sp. 2310opik-2]|uniref:hypothetical protein n=1 Tax=Fervidobacterium sp. 2310opik-2 TaxID=1755815 RepID=UPI0013DF1915|nr:hypothetical protein [Fervidobacterium sp. 2310opik-2]KAF2962424.1 hypothetical protein AS161_04600 [Fervidobacterium sp. 2310opik-2]